jgi:hypothetical protein
MTFKQSIAHYNLTQAEISKLSIYLDNNRYYRMDEILDAYRKQEISNGMLNVARLLNAKQDYKYFLSHIEKANAIVAKGESQITEDEWKFLRGLGYAYEFDYANSDVHTFQTLSGYALYETPKIYGYSSVAGAFWNGHLFPPDANYQPQSLEALSIADNEHDWLAY